MLVLATRLSSRLGFPATAERWKDTAIKLPDSLLTNAMTEIFSKQQLRLSDNSLNLAEAMAVLPFAVYTNL